jgi:hypothetical protein
VGLLAAGIDRSLWHRLVTGNGRFTKHNKVWIEATNDILDKVDQNKYIFVYHDKDKCSEKNFRCILQE